MKPSDSGSIAECSRHTHTSRVRVRYGETDAMGRVYYANYFYYFEVGRSDLIRSVWKSYRQMEEEGLILPVVEAACKYVRGARYEDEIDVHSILSMPSRFRLRFDYEVRHAESRELLARGHTEHCFIDEAGKPMRIPGDLREALA